MLITHKNSITYLDFRSFRLDRSTSRYVREKLDFNIVAAADTHDETQLPLPCQGSQLSSQVMQTSIWSHNGNSHTERVKFCSWQHSREVQEPLPRTIKGRRVAGAERGATAARASLPPRVSLRHSAAGHRSERTRACWLPRNTRVLFRWDSRVQGRIQDHISEEENQSKRGTKENSFARTQN